MRVRQRGVPGSTLVPAIAVWTDLNGPLNSPHVSTQRTHGLRTMFMTDVRPSTSRTGVIDEHYDNLDEDAYLDLGDDTSSGTDDPSAFSTSTDPTAGAAPDQAMTELVEVVLSFAQDPGEAHAPSWRLTLPATWVGMVTAMTGSSLALPLVLIEDTAPDRPEFSVLDVDPETSLAVIPVPSHLENGLRSSLGPALVRPAHVHTEQDHGLPFDPARDLLWVTAASLAVGQATAKGRLRSLGLYLEACQNSTHHPGALPDSAPDPEMLLPAEMTSQAFELLDRFDLASLARMVREPVSRLVVWPDAMGFLSEQDTRFEPLFLDVANRATARDTDLAPGEGLPGDPSPWPMVTVSSLLGLHSPAVLVEFAVALLAAAATRVSESAQAIHGPRWTTPSYVLTQWFDNDPSPWWATRATWPLLAEHETAILIDLTVAAPHGDQPAFPLLLDGLLHALPLALEEAGATGPEAAEAVRINDVRPTNIDDCATLAHIAAACAYEVDPDQCSGCALTAILLSINWTAQRTAEAVAALWPVLADIDADHLPVGAPEWLEWRSTYLSAWLMHPALVSPVVGTEVVVASPPTTEFRDMLSLNRPSDGHDPTTSTPGSTAGSTADAHGYRPVDTTMDQSDPPQPMTPPSPRGEDEAPDSKDT